MTPKHRSLPRLAHYMVMVGAKPNHAAMVQAIWSGRRDLNPRPAALIQPLGAF